MNASIAPVSAFESIRWHNAARELPDCNTSVLVYAPDNAEPVCIGFYDSETGLWVSDWLVEYPAGQVKAWADLPAGAVP